MTTPSLSPITVLITRAGMGHADPELQEKLITTYFRLLDDSHTLPAVIAFYTEGVHLCCTGSPVLDTLRSLAANGVRLVLCSTCLTFYGLTEQVEVGIVGGMTDIITAQWQAEKVITL